MILHDIGLFITGIVFGGGSVILGTPHTFKAGWDACAKEYEKENAELKRQFEIAKEALKAIESAGE